MVTSSAGLGPESDCTGKTHPLVREGAIHQESRNCQKEKKNLVIGSSWEPDIKIDWPTERRSKLTSASTLEHLY
jgi:hypothetical protein